jgi:hypothetical protein
MFSAETINGNTPSVFVSTIEFKKISPHVAIAQQNLGQMHCRPSIMQAHAGNKPYRCRNYPHPHIVLTRTVAADV